MPPEFSEEEVTAGARALCGHENAKERLDPHRDPRVRLVDLVFEDWREEFEATALKVLVASGAVPAGEYEREHSAANEWSRRCVEETVARVAAEAELERV